MKSNLHFSLDAKVVFLLFLKADALAHHGRLQDGVPPLASPLLSDSSLPLPSLQDDSCSVWSERVKEKLVSGPHVPSGDFFLLSGELGALEQEVHLSPSHCISSLTLTRPPPSPSFQGPPDRPYPKDTCGPGGVPWPVLTLCLSGAAHSSPRLQPPVADAS